MSTPRPLWKEMMDREDAAIEGCDDLQDADRLSREASILAVRDRLFPFGAPDPRESAAGARVYYTLTTEARIARRGE